MEIDLSEPNQTLFYPEMSKIIGSNGCCFILFIYFISYFDFIFISFIFFRIYM